MSKKKLIIVTYGGGHVNMLIPVIKELKKNKNLELIVLGLTTAGGVLKRHGITSIGFKDLLVPEDQHALAWGRKLVDPEGSFKLVSLEESTAYMGLSYMDLENRYGIEEAADIYQNKGGRQAFLPITIMERFLRIEQPDLVVATSSPRAERAVISVARNLSIPAICIVDLFAIHEVQWLGKPGYANKVCVLSEFVKQHLMRAGRRSDEIVVTGNPSFDQLERYKEKQDVIRNRKNWSKNKKVFLWASQPEPELHHFSNERGNPKLPREIDQKLFDILDANPDWHLVIRPHPSEELNYMSLPDNIELSNNSDPLYELLSAVDVVITMTSTVGLEAVLMGKPLIALDLSICNKYAPYSDMRIAKGVDSFDKLEAAMISVLSGEWECSVDLPDIGNSTARVISVINDYL